MVTASAISEIVRKEAEEQAAIQNAVWMTTQQVARLLQISPSTLEKARSTGKGAFALLNYSKIGAAIRYNRQEIERFMKNHKFGGC